MENARGPVWVITEQIGGRVLTVSLQLIGQARKLADELETSVDAVLLGYELNDQPRQLFAAGADRVYLGNDPGGCHPLLPCARRYRQRQALCHTTFETYVGGDLITLAESDVLDQESNHTFAFPVGCPRIAP